MAGWDRQMSLNEFSAREILDAAHAAWSEGNVEGVLAQYVDDLIYWCNTGAPNGTALTIVGKAELRAFLQTIAEVAESVSVSDYFRYRDGLGRAKIDCYIRHKKSGLMLCGSYRQVVTFRDQKISRLEEYHDAARMAAFWRLIAGETALALN